MATKTRYVIIYKSNDPEKTSTISFGIKAKKKSQALKKTREYIYGQELHDDSKGFDYSLSAVPSLKLALHEIPDEMSSVDVDDDEHYNYFED
jgi:hypothetical protein